jgi:hypothetical protein
MWSHIKAVFRNLLHTQQVESELDDEIASYVDAVTEEKIAAGFAPEEARRRALAECGGTEHVKRCSRLARASSLTSKRTILLPT